MTSLGRGSRQPSVLCSLPSHGSSKSQ